ncbi:MAG: serine--tRNA ligase [Flavobacteriales bacterium]|nr:serine--tRNA ligase [Flavobacteriales bacterium]
MLQTAWIRENKEEAIQRLAIRNIEAGEIIERVIQMDDSRKNKQLELDNLLAEGNILSKEIGRLFQSGKKSEADQLKNKTLEIKELSKQFEEELHHIENGLKDLLLTLPNAPSLKVPKGKTPEENEIVALHGKPPVFENQPLPHWELAKKYDLIDFELGVKITGAGFPVYKGKGARLQRALINFFLDQAIRQGYTEIQPPILINEDSAFGTGQLPDKEGQMYHARDDNFYLIPTAEVPITNIYRDVILKESDLPIKNVGYTPCFRREAGSYGKDVRGLNRLHQFDKVEIVQISHPDTSYEVLEEMRHYVCSLLEKLGLQFRVLKLCGGDMGFTSALTYDMEVYSAAQEKWLEVSSVSNFETFQSNRLKLRFKENQGKTSLVHTLNGSALALPRIVASLLENNQTAKGIVMPEVLIPYLGFEIID